MSTKRTARARRGKLSRRGARTSDRNSLQKRVLSKSKKLAISFEGPLAEQVVGAARLESGGNVSAWLAEAARLRLRQKALREALAAYEADHGEITQAELTEVRRAWPAD